MSKLDDLNLADLLNIVSPDAKISNKKPSEETPTVVTKQTSTLPSSALKKIESSTQSKESFKQTSSSSRSQKESRRKKASADNTSSQEVLEKQSTRSSLYTTIRVLKKKMQAIRLLFPDMSCIDIIDFLVTEYLEDNKEELKTNIATLSRSRWEKR